MTQGTQARSPIDIGQVIFYANAFNPRKRIPVMADEQIPADVEALLSLLHNRQIEHVLVGGIAVLQYVSGRNTEDIDLIMAASDLSHVPELHITDRNPYFATARFGQLRVELLLTANPLFLKVSQFMSIEQQFTGHTIRCATVEGLVLLKLYALPSLYRTDDFARVSLYENDVAALVQAYRPPVDPLLDELSVHLDDGDMREIRAIVAEIETRIERFERHERGPANDITPPTS